MAIYSQEKSARTAYEVYSTTVGGLTWDGRPMPTWETLPMRQRDAWVKGVSAAVDEFNHFLIESEAVTYAEPQFTSKTTLETTPEPEEKA